MAAYVEYLPMNKRVFFRETIFTRLTATNVFIAL